MLYISLRFMYNSIDYPNKMSARALSAPGNDNTFTIKW